MENGDETIVLWLNQVTINKRNSIAKVKIDAHLTPYLFNFG